MSKKPDKDCRWCKGSGVIQGMAYAKWPCECVEQPAEEEYLDLPVVDDFKEQQRKALDDLSQMSQDMGLYDMAQLPSSWPYASTPDAFELPDWPGITLTQRPGYEEAMRAGAVTCPDEWNALCGAAERLAEVIETDCNDAFELPDWPGPIMRGDAAMLDNLGITKEGFEVLKAASERLAKTCDKSTEEALRELIYGKAKRRG